jgi:integrase
MVVDRKANLLNKKADRTVHEALSILRALLYFAQKNYESPSGKPLLERNPVTCAERYSEKLSKTTLLPESILPLWYKAVMSTTWASSRDYLYFALISGLRKMEAMTLEWRDVDFENGTITIRAEICRNCKALTLPMSKHIHAFLVNRKQLSSASIYVFPGQSSKGRLRSCQRVTAEVGRKIGYKFTMDDVRRTFQYGALQAGVSAHLVKKLSNSVGIQCNVDLLHQPNLEELRSAMEKISQWLVEKMAVNAGYSVILLPEISAQQTQKYVD